jgi:TraX protein
MASTAPDLTSSRLPADFAQGDLEFAKWVAIVTMAIDHYGKIVDDSVFVQTHAIGRVSFPLFAAIVGIRLAARPTLDLHYLRYLIPWAIVSQPVFVLVGRAWYEGNILITLALGVTATFLLRRRAEISEWLLVAVLVAILILSVFVDYGPLGVAMIPAMALLVAQGESAGVAAAGPLGLSANVYPSPPYIELPDLTALLATPILLFSLWAKIRLPRLPTQVFYGFYPAHLLALHVYGLYG